MDAADQGFKEPFKGLQEKKDYVEANLLKTYLKQIDMAMAMVPGRLGALSESELMEDVEHAGAGRSYFASQGAACLVAEAGAVKAEPEAVHGHHPDDQPMGRRAPLMERIRN